MTKLMGALLLAASACGEVLDKPPGTFSLTLDPTNAFLRQGESTDLQVNVERADLADPIRITVDNLPAGVTAGALEIGEDQTTGTLTLAAASTATHGFASFTINGAVIDGEGTSDVGFDLLVGGAPGDLDQSFATDGTFTPALGGLAMACRGVTITDQGIIVTGFVVSNPIQAITARVLDDGTLDPAYGSGGFVSTGAGTIAEGIALAPLADGSVIAAGIAGSDGASDNNFGLFRYDNSGVLDATFGASGVESFNPGTGFAEYHNIVLAADGSLLVGGTVFGNTTSTRAFRYSATGSRDTTYDVNEANVAVQGSALQPDGKLLMVGTLAGDFWVARYTTTGARDTGFGGGIVQTDFSNLTDTAHGVTVLADGKILVIGISAAAGAPISTISLARYNANGSLDVTFGSGGKIASQTQFESRSPTAIAVRDNFVYFVGRRASDDQPAVARFNLSDGSLDTTFGTTGGIVAVDFGVAGTTSSTGGFGVAVDAVGRVVISGDVGAAGAQQMAIARLWF